MVTTTVLLAAAAVIVVVRLVGWLLGRLGQPAVIGEIIAGILLGPSVLGLVWGTGRDVLFPPEVISGFRVMAQFGLVMFMFLVGMELDLRILRGHGRKSAVVSLTSVVVPFALGATLGALLHERFGAGHGPAAFSLFLGAAISITAFPVLARILRETALDRTRVGVIALTCAAVDDVVAWCLLAVVTAVAGSTSTTDTAWCIGLALLYVVLMVKVVKPFLSRFGRLPLWAVLAVAFLSAYTTEMIGIHAIFGGFLAGVIMPRPAGWQESIKVRLEGLVSTFVLPLFFVVVGMSTRIDQLGSWSLVGVLAAVIAVAVAGKLGAAGLAARATGERWDAALTIGILMNTRGLTEIVILTVGLELGVIDESLFTVMVIMALVTTVMAAPLLRLIAKRSADLPVRHGVPAGGLSR